MSTSGKTLLRYILGRTNHADDGSYGTSNFHVNPYFSCVTATRRPNRSQWIAEIKSKVIHMSRRSQNIEFRLMASGHIRAVQTHRPDSATASEWCVYPAKGISPTIKTKGGEHIKILMADERILKALKAANEVDGICNTLAGVKKDNLILTKHIDMTTELTYHEHPTKEELLEYFGPRVSIRKVTESEALRLMDVSQEDILKLVTATETITLKNGKTKTKKTISKTALYKLAGNSIVVAQIDQILDSLLFPDTPPPPTGSAIQLTLF